MQPKSIVMPASDIYKYIVEKGVKLTDVQEELFQETMDSVGPSQMMSSKDQIRFFEILMKLTGCKKGIEIGTFTGFSALGFAYGLPEDGKLIALDINSDWASIAQKYWKKANMDKKIELRIGLALDTLKAMQNEKEMYDFAFIDADKDNYLNYYEALLPLIKHNGFILVDNVLFHGRVIVPEEELASSLKQKIVTDEPKYLIETEACEKKLKQLVKGVKVIKEFNDLLNKDERIEAVILGIADGITLIRKK